MAINKITLSFLLLVFFICNANAQLYIFYKDALSKIKDGSTHVVVDDLNFPGSAGFIAIFKKYWTLTKSVDFVTSTDLQGNLKAGDSYFSLQSVYISSGGGGNTYTFLNLWMPHERALKPGRKFTDDDKNAIAHIQLGTDKQVLMSSFDFDGGGHIYNWNPAMLKNYLLQLNIFLQAGKRADFSDGVTNKSQLALLKDQTLYCPQDDFHKFYPMGKDGTEQYNNTDEIFEDYKLNYKVLSDKDMEDKILADKEPFYYLLFARNSSAKLVTVVNSRTGEVIYSRYHTLMAFNLKPSDLKDLYNEIR